MGFPVAVASVFLNDRPLTQLMMPNSFAMKDESSIDRFLIGWFSYPSILKARLMPL